MTNHTITLERNTDRMSPNFHRFCWVETFDGFLVQTRAIEREQSYPALGFDTYEDHARGVVTSIAATYGATARFDGYGVSHPMFDGA